MNTKYVFVTGGVVSGLGKGITAASLGRLLKNRGYKVAIQKFDPYLNVDPGTMNPYEHGEVFVTDDGAETDLDLGHYERFINENYESMRITNLDICGMTGKKDGDLFPGCRNIYQSGYMEVHRDDCDKSSGIKAIAAYLGIPLGQTVSFGDSSNDIDMLRCTGTSVIMHAAPESLNDFAALRTESDEDGVAEAIDKLFFE